MTITARNTVSSSGVGPARGPRRVATAVLGLVSVGIVVIGTRFLVQPGAAATGFGVATSPDDPFLAVKGVRDIGSGVLLATVLVLAERRVAGWVGLAAALIPLGDTVVVLARGGPLGTALGVHGATALVMAAAGLTLGLTDRRES